MSSVIQKPEEVTVPDGDASKLVAQSPSPTRFRLWSRRFIPWQFLKFMSINLNILRMIIKGH